ncbi:copper-translocating P-type ATPase, partial [Lactobacillus delbrueckii subsp. lactis]|nr:copper-translocating P-type ATPase [Lactobacillus delbrueckii subsp. lactis]
MAWCSAKQKPKYKNLVEKSRARGFPHKELIFRLLTALLRTLIFRGSIIMANKEEHMNMKNMSAKNMENNESNMSHMD